MGEAEGGLGWWWRWGGTLELGPARIDLLRHEIVGPSGQQALSAQEVALLQYLAERRGQAVPRAELLQAVWGYHPDARTRAVDHTVNRLRKKIELEPRKPRFLMSVYGVGYRLELADLTPEATDFERPHLPDRASRGSRGPAGLRLAPSPRVAPA